MTSSDMEAVLCNEPFVEPLAHPSQKGAHGHLTPTPLTSVTPPPQGFNGYYHPHSSSPELTCTANSTPDLNDPDKIWKLEAPQNKKAMFSWLSFLTKFLSDSGGRDRARIECIACGDKILSRKGDFRAPCAHHYCMECLANFAKASTRDESLYPLQCCQMRMSTKRVARRLPKQLQARFRAKSIEYSVPPATRVYCANRKCSTFICSSSTRSTNITCRVCGITTCLLCRNRRHPGEDCVEAETQKELKTLADDKNWQSCPGCQAVVERTDGCSHITCRCSTHFCYQCGARWQKCFCHREDY